MIASLYLNEAFSHDTIKNTYNNSLEFVIGAVYENEISMNKAYISLLENNSGFLYESSTYINEETINGFFKTIKDAISTLINNVIGFFKGVSKITDIVDIERKIHNSNMTIDDINNQASKYDFGDKQFYKFKFNYDIVSDLSKLIDVDLFMKYAEVPSDLVDGNDVPLLLAKDYISKYLYTYCDLALNDNELEMSNIRKSIYDKLVIPIAYCPLLTEEDFYNSDTYESNFSLNMNLYSQMQKLADDTLSHVKTTLRTKEYSKDIVIKVKDAINEMNKFLQYCTLVLLEIDNIIRMQFEQTDVICSAGISTYKKQILK